MAPLAAVAPIISGVVGLAGAFVSAAGTIAAGKARQKAADYEAEQLEIRGQEERATAQRKAFEYKRQTNLALSRLQSLAGKSGAATSSADILSLTSDIYRRGRYQQRLQQREGDEAQRGRYAQAETTRLSGDIAAAEARTAALGTILGGVGGLFQSFGDANVKFGSSGRTNYFYGGRAYA